jgi:hypothetical protein
VDHRQYGSYPQDFGEVGFPDMILKEAALPTLEIAYLP